MFTREGIMDITPSIYGPRVDGSKIQVFNKKSDAVKTAKRLNLPLNTICPIQTRFQVGYGIYCPIGRGYLIRQTPTLV